MKAIRPIKFRGIFEHCDEDEGSARWIYGSLVKEDEENVYIFPEGHFCFAHGDLYFDSPWQGGPNLLCYVPSVKPETVGQFTGLKDKNGKEIYEGDVIESDSIRHVVKYSESEAMFVGVSTVIKDSLTGEYAETSLSQHWINGWGKEIIGNIYDNPELLKEE